MRVEEHRRGRQGRACLLACARVLLLCAGVLSVLPTDADARGVSIAQPGSLTVSSVRGVVEIRLPGNLSFIRLATRRAVPSGTQIDARKGTVHIIGGIGSGNFYGGKFVLSAPTPPATHADLQLLGGNFQSCRVRRMAAGVGSRSNGPPPHREVRHLWGDAKGKFRTRARYSFTTVRGTLWLTDDFCDGSVTQVDRGQVSVFDVVAQRSVVVDAGKSYASRIPREFPVPTDLAAPDSIAAGPDGNLWFAEGAAAAVGKSTPAGVITEYPLPDESGVPSKITNGPDGNLWFTEDLAALIGRITPAGVLTEFPIPDQAVDITTGPDGALWFTEANGARIGRITTGGSVTEFALPPIISSTDPDTGVTDYTYGSQFGITSGPDGNIWFADSYGNQIGRLTPNGIVQTFPLPTESASPTDIVAGPDRNLWFTEGVGQIGRITPAGKITEFPLPDETRYPQEITSAGGNLWFTERNPDQVAFITPAGSITEIPIPTPDSTPGGIVQGPDGNIWFTEEATNSLGCIGC
jgi:streptogramin lyase